MTVSSSSRSPHASCSCIFSTKMYCCFKFNTYTSQQLTGEETEGARGSAQRWLEINHHKSFRGQGGRALLVQSCLIKLEFLNLSNKYTGIWIALQNIMIQTNWTKSLIRSTGHCVLPGCYNWINQERTAERRRKKRKKSGGLETAFPSSMMESRWMTPYQWEPAPLCIPKLGCYALLLKAEAVWRDIKKK